MANNYFTPEDIQRLNESPERRRALQERIARARAMGQAPQKFDTWGGALLGGLGDVFTAIAGKEQEGRAQKELDEETKGASETRGRVLRKAFEAEDGGGNSYGGQGSPEGSYPPQGAPGSSTGSNAGPAPYYIANPNPQSITSQLSEAYTPSPGQRTAALAAALKRNPGQLATLMAASGDPMLERVGELRLQDIRAAQLEQQRETEYGRTRADKQSDVASQRTFESEQHALDRTSRENAAAASRLWDIRLADRTDTRREEKAQRAATVPGMEVTPGEAPTPEDAKKVKASRAAAERMGRYVQELRELHKAKGTEYGGEAGNRMQQLAEQIKLEAKNIGELGVISGPDAGILERISGADPGSFTANFKSLVGVDNTQSALTGLEKWVNDTVEGNAAAYGYRPKGGSAGPNVDDVLKAFGR